jgi:ATP-dependent helicase/nuclease subunit B
MKLNGNGGTQTAAAVFFDRVAHAMLAQHAHELPDLRRVVVLLPNYHVAVPLAQHLARAAGLPALLLPQMVTLNDWVQSVPLAQAITPDSCRATTLYQALRSGNWFPDADLWGIATELLGLIDELTRHRVPLPHNAEDFLAQLERAYQARRNSAMQFEARVVHELWYAMNARGAAESGAELDAARATQQRLAQLAQQAAAPLYVLLASDLAQPEQRFLQEYSAHAPVSFFDLRALSGQQAAAKLMHAAWGSAENADEMQLLQQAGQLREHSPHSAWGSRLRLFAAHGLEQEARAAEVQVRRWLLAGKRSIAIVAQDRLAARRVRALLERAEVQVRDETGWTLSTMAVSTVLMRWLDALQSDFYYQDLLDLLKSPFIFSELAASERKQRVYQLEQLVRKHGVVAHLDAYFELAGADDPALAETLARLRQAGDALRKKSNTLAGWLEALQHSLDILGVLPGLAADAAGEQLLRALQTWQQELAADSTRFSRGEWRHWLALQLDAQTFRDLGIDSPVIITHLAATRWRSFDAVLLLGCDDAHLPSADKKAVWFNDAVRDTLGLPVAAVYRAQQRDDLLALLAMNDSVLATWQASKGGEANLLSPYLEMLRALHELAYGDDLAEKELAAMLDAAQVRSTPSVMPQVAAMPAPAVPYSLIPAGISASGYNSLVACPYQYYARHVLRLNELDEVREGIEKRDYGEWIHDILYRFHEAYSPLEEFDRAELESALQRISEEVFARAVEHDYWARAWLLRWQKTIPAYLDAQAQIEAEGWHYVQGEVAFKYPLSPELQIHGRIDRVDVMAQVANVERVLDYKTLEAARLRNKLKEPGEDVQLPFYAYARDACEGAFFSLDKDQASTVAPAQEIRHLSLATIQRLLAVFAMLREGAPMPANGIAAVCAHCEMHGLCRKAEWK